MVVQSALREVVGRDLAERTYTFAKAKEEDVHPLRAVAMPTRHEGPPSLAETRGYSKPICRLRRGKRRTLHGAVVNGSGVVEPLLQQLHQRLLKELCL